MNLRRINMASLQDASQKWNAQKSQKDRKINFDEMLKAESAGIKFSKHATERMQSRKMEISPSQMKRVETAIKRAKEKGLAETLVLVDDMAFIASAKSDTIITALPKADIEGNIFTNIDGAVIV